MLNDYGKSLFKPLVSAPNIVLGLSVLFVAGLVVKYVALSSSEWASWVQAVGAIVSICAAWLIASRQSSRAEVAAKRQDAARCAAIIGVLKYSLQTIEHQTANYNVTISADQVKNDIVRVVCMLDRIDLLALPDQAVVNAVCVVRRAVELLDKKMDGYVGQAIFPLHYNFSIAKSCVETIAEQLCICEAVVSDLLGK